MPMLLGPQQIASTAYLQITHSYLKARSQLSKVTDRLQAFFRYLAQSPVAFINKIGIGQPRRPPYPSTHLVQLRQAEILRAVDDDGIGQWYIQAIFDDRVDNSTSQLPS